MAARLVGSVHGPLGWAKDLLSYRLMDFCDLTWKMANDEGIRQTIWESYIQPYIPSSGEYNETLQGEELMFLPSWDWGVVSPGRES